MKKRLEVLKDKTDLYEEMRQCRSKRGGQRLAIDYYKKYGILTRQGCKKWLQYIRGWSLPINNKGQTDIMALGFIGYLVLMVIVLLCIF